MNKKTEAFERLLEIMDTLREKCPWDREQTWLSLREKTIEESFELTDAILQGDMQEIKKELGDVLLHIVFYAKMGSEEGQFDISDVINSLCDKLVFRHPHIYSTVEADTAVQVTKNWEQLKQVEKGGNKSVLAGVSKGIPSLIKASRMQQKAAAVGFDWEKREDVWQKVKEEIAEVQVEINSMENCDLSLGSNDLSLGNNDLSLVSNDLSLENKGLKRETSTVNTQAEMSKKAIAQRLEGEFGDLLFSIVNAARLYGVDPDTALERTNQKFIHRFNYLESKTLKQGRKLEEMTLEEMDEIWNEAKSFENK